MASPRDESSPIASDDEGEDLMDNLADDYRDIDELDDYDEENIDNENYEADMFARRRAEREMDDRDVRTGRARRGRGAFIPTALHTPDVDAATMVFGGHLSGAGPAQAADDEPGVNLEDFQGPLREWLEEERVQREIKRRFRKFLTEYVDGSGTPPYPHRIREMCSENRCSLEVNYMDLGKFEPVLAIWIADCPQIILEVFDEVVMEVAKFEFRDYDSIHPHIHARISNLPLKDELRELRQMHLNQFIQVGGVVTRRTNKFPQLQRVKYDCLKCGFILGPYAQQSGKEIRPPSCPDCQSKGPFRLNENQTVYRNYQKVVLQESPGSVPAGRIPRSRDIILVDDLCDSVRPGEQIKVTGVYKHVLDMNMNARQGFPVFSTVIEANHIVKEKDYFAQYNITDDDISKIQELAARPDIEQLIVNSIAPSIYGHQYIKRALALALFGGQEKKKKNKHRIRGDINILILGDPGLGKSQFLRYIENVAFRAVYATGKGASAVGLTAAVHRDPVTREWTLEGGALVLADRGICLIDEFDKMNDQDRTSIHEAMEQQSISISKAGIVASLQARCSVIAAANPIRGRYDGSLTFVENVDLTDPILSRFDILAVVRDKVDPVQDERLANFVWRNHVRCHPDYEGNDEDNDVDMENDQKVDGPETIDQELLRKYILYAKEHCHPKLANIDRDKIAKFYADLRQKSMDGGGIPIAVRHIESILRMAEARAKVQLRDFVRDDDVDMAIRVMLESFIDTQKQSNQTSLRAYFKSYLTYQRDTSQLLLHILETAVAEELQYQHFSLGSSDSPRAVEIDVEDFRNKALQYKISNLQPFFSCDRFHEAGFIVKSVSEGRRRKEVIMRQFSSS